MYPVRLTTGRVVLREFRAEDADAVFGIVGDPRVTEWLSFDTRTREQAVAMVDGIVVRAREEPRSEYYLAVTLPGADTLIGFCLLGLTGVRAARLGFAIAAGRWNKGYATEAARALTGFAFEGLDLHRVSAAIGPSNIASIAVVTKLGFSYEGRIRDHVFTAGAWRDSRLYSLLEHERPR